MFIGAKLYIRTPKSADSQYTSRIWYEQAKPAVQRTSRCSAKWVPIATNLKMFKRFLKTLGNIEINFEVSQSRSNNNMTIVVFYKNVLLKIENKKFWFSLHGILEEVI